MKQILQVLDRASSRKVEGADDMRRFVSTVRALNTPVVEAGKPGDPGFKPNLQVPTAPVLPNVQLQPGANDMGDGVSIKLNPDGSKEHASGQGLFKFDKNNKPIMYRSPSFSGLSQEHDLVTGNITVRYMAGPLNTSQTYDKTGKPLETDAEYNMGTTTVGMNKNAKGITSKRMTTQDPNNAPSGKDLYAMGNKDKEATYNRAMAQVNAPATEGKKSFLDYLQEAEQGLLAEAKATKTRLDPKCWSGKKIGNPKTKVKGGVRVNNCVPKESVSDFRHKNTVPVMDKSTSSRVKDRPWAQRAINHVLDSALKVLEPPSNVRIVGKSYYGDPVQFLMSEIKKIILKHCPADEEVYEKTWKRALGDANQQALAKAKIQFPTAGLNASIDAQQLDKAYVTYIQSFEAGLRAAKTPSQGAME